MQLAVEEFFAEGKEPVAGDRWATAHTQLLHNFARRPQVGTAWTEFRMSNFMRDIPSVGGRTSQKSRHSPARRVIWRGNWQEVARVAIQHYVIQYILAAAIMLNFLMKRFVYHQQKRRSLVFNCGHYILATIMILYLHSVVCIYIHNNKFGCM
jgi:hypothetical protein